MLMRFMLPLLLVTVAAAGPARAQEADSVSRVLFTNVHVFDGVNEDRIENAYVLVEDNLIKTVSTDPLPAGGATVIDGGGRTLIPGMIDVHWHVILAETPVTSILGSGDFAEAAIRGAMSAEGVLMRGFTTVRDMGGNPFSIKNMIDSGDLTGPRIYPSGPAISQTSGHFDIRGKNDVPAGPSDTLDYWARVGVFVTADGVPEVTKRVREALRLGATQIKLAAGGGTSSPFDPLDVQQFTLAELQAAVEVAETWNTYVTVHAYTPDAVNTALDAGVRVIEHGQLLDDATMRRIADEGIWLSLQPFLIEDDSQYAPDPFVRSKQEQMVKGTGQAYELAKKHDVKVAFGTDILFTPGGGSQQSHMVNLLTTGFGYTPHQALKMVTHDNAQLLKLSGERNPYPGELGIVQEGAYADLILVDGNPLENLALVEDPDANFKVIMKDGKIHKNTLDN